MAAIRREMEVRHFKWDAQVGDVDVLAPVPLIVDRATWTELATLAERLAAETIALEHALLARPDLLARLAVPRALQRLFARLPPTPAAVRVMRFDFHPTRAGWRVSEVNSDVPGGYTEASELPRLVAAHVPNARPAGDPTAAVVDALARWGSVALVDAPGHVEDRQILAFLAAQLARRGASARLCSIDDLSWRDGAASVGGEPVGAIFRFYRTDWLSERRDRARWEPLFAGGTTPVANPGAAALTETKRLPLVWDALPIAVPTWRALLPETRALANAPWFRDDGWLVKRAFSDTGEAIAGRAITRGWLARAAAIRIEAGAWVAQRRFAIEPLAGDVRPCVGVYTVDGRVAGAYARLATGEVVDHAARDAALLVVDA